MLCDFIHISIGYAVLCEHRVVDVFLPAGVLEIKTKLHQIERHFQKVTTLRKPQTE